MPSLWAWFGEAKTLVRAQRDDITAGRPGAYLLRCVAMLIQANPLGLIDGVGMSARAAASFRVCQLLA